MQLQSYISGFYQLEMRTGSGHIRRKVYCIQSVTSSVDIARDSVSGVVEVKTGASKE